MQSRQQHVEQPAGPGPVRRRPEPVAQLRQKFVREFDAGEMAEQHAVRVQRALGRAGSAGGVDHQRGVIGAGTRRREIAGGARQRGVKVFRAARGAVEREHEIEAERRVAGELRQSLRVGDQRARAGILEPIGDRVDAEQHCQRQRNCAELVDGDVAHCDGRPLRQQDRDPIAAPNAAGRERVGEPVRGFTQLAVIHFFNFAIGPHVENRSTRRIDLCPAVADVDANIVARRNLPAERAVERGVLARVRKDRGCVHRSAS